MNTQNTIPAAFTFNALQAMRILHDVEMKLAGNENVIALSIKSALKTKPYISIIHFIKDMATDNRPSIEFIIGAKLTDEILNFK